mmetsp:Transcript_21970/g.40378  ORF Transcript_21970/g.40378 Transcript_21970/m.40378 type:complete len:115 (-) Transcript_21970:61-405(-)
MCIPCYGSSYVGQSRARYVSQPLLVGRGGMTTPSLASFSSVRQHRHRHVKPNFSSRFRLSSNGCPTTEGRYAIKTSSPGSRGLFATEYSHKPGPSPAYVEPSGAKSISQFGKQE